MRGLRVYTSSFSLVLYNQLRNYTLHSQRIAKFSTLPPKCAQDFIVARAPKGGTYRVNITKSPHLIGTATSRGTRPDNEDRYRFSVVELPLDTKEHDAKGNLQEESNEQKHQMAYVGIFDGHGGPDCSMYLADHLHEHIESSVPSSIPALIKEFRSLGGYFRRFNPHSLMPFLSTGPKDEKSQTPSTLTLEQRLNTAFLRSDLECIRAYEMRMMKQNRKGGSHEDEGSTASIALLEGMNGEPFWACENLTINVAHVGDSRIILCDARTGEADLLTSHDHHPDQPIEQDRLRKYAGFITTDSFGDNRILGMLQVSRSVGDARLKKFGVSAEPDVVKRTLKGRDVAFMVLITDGITSVMSNQEVVDLIKQYPDPTQAAEKLVNLADQYGTEDNTTAVVVRLPGWGSSMPDLTEKLRRYRSEEENSMSHRQSW